MSYGNDGEGTGESEEREDEDREGEEEQQREVGELDEELEWEENGDGEWEEANEWESEGEIREGIEDEGEELFSPSSEREDREVEDVISKSFLGNQLIKSVSNERPPLPPIAFRNSYGAKKENENECNESEKRVEDKKEDKEEDKREKENKESENKVGDRKVDRMAREAQRLQKREAEKRRIQQEIEKLRKLKTEEEDGVLRGQQEKRKEGQEQVNNSLVKKKDKFL
jgi:hypothetical protein